MKDSEPIIKSVFLLVAVVVAIGGLALNLWIQSPDLQAEYDELKREYTQLESKVSDLKERISELERELAALREPGFANVGVWILTTSHRSSLDTVYVDAHEGLGCNWVYLTFIHEWGSSQPLELVPMADMGQARQQGFDLVFWVGTIEQWHGMEEGQPTWAQDYYFPGLVKTLDEPRTMFDYSEDQVVEWAMRFLGKGQVIGLEFDVSLDEDSPLSRTDFPKIEYAYASRILAKMRVQGADFSRVWIGGHYYPFRQWTSANVEAFGPIMRKWRGLADQYGAKFFWDFQCFGNPPFWGFKRLVELAEGTADTIVFHAYGDLKGLGGEHWDYVRSLTSTPTPTPTSTPTPTLTSVDSDEDIWGDSASAPCPV
ncbi:MAG: coiled-coil domain-containing protein [Candidatus Bathyarchaeia archaeon]